ncbi:hypothetical protein [Prevotella sp. 10(H)]|uniref:hypothetical protein n=1 Tax=Prevotella sp. 10(H) TaxID=1158294 RepID=UPI0004A72111|nr:hypothetical protein [Prevotella sp. 10(H)]
MNETDLKQEVEELISDVDKTHRYSMSRIYGLSNKVFGRNETPQSCASCLIRKVRELRSWLDTQKEAEPAAPAKEQTKKIRRNRKKENDNGQL